MSESVFKVLVIGDPKVGKTSMVARYCYRDWMPNYKATVGGILLNTRINLVSNIPQCILKLTKCVWYLLH